MTPIFCFTSADRFYGILHNMASVLEFLPDHPDMINIHLVLQLIIKKKICCGQISEIWEPIEIWISQNLFVPQKIPLAAELYQ